LNITILHGNIQGKELMRKRNGIDFILTFCNNSYRHYWIPKTKGI